jgi:hypothetical protein
VLRTANAVLVCVPTPLSKTRDPDIHHILEAMEAIVLHQHEGMLVVLESTSYSGTTRELLVPRLTRGRFRLGESVFVACSPERIDPGNPSFRLENTPKVVGGACAASLRVASALYATFVERLVPVSSPEVAETSKLLENTFRAVNIALVNEFALIGAELGVNAREVVEAAATKPFGFMPFYPGPGLGGHCVPVDPLCLSWRVRRVDQRARLVELADTINRSMPAHLVGSHQRGTERPLPSAARGQSLGLRCSVQARCGRYTRIARDRRADAASATRRTSRVLRSARPPPGHPRREPRGRRRGANLRRLGCRRGRDGSLGTRSRAAAPRSFPHRRRSRGARRVFGYLLPRVRVVSRAPEFTV